MLSKNVKISKPQAYYTGSFQTEKEFEMLSMYRKYSTEQQMVCSLNDVRG